MEQRHQRRVSWRHGVAIAAVILLTLQDDDVEGFGLLDPENARRPAWSAYRDAMGD